MNTVPQIKVGDQVLVQSREGLDRMVKVLEVYDQPLADYGQLDRFLGEFEVPTSGVLRRRVFFKTEVLKVLGEIERPLKNSLCL